MEYPLCACGCGEQITRKARPERPNKFIHGHHRRGIVMSEDQKRKIGISNSGRPMSKRQKDLLSKLRKESIKNGTITHWAYTDKKEEIGKKIQQKRKGNSFTKTIVKGKFITKNGYVMIYFRNHFGKRYGYMLEHRYLLEKHHGAPLSPAVSVHHIDGDKTNNSIENLLIFPTKSAHTKFHILNGYPSQMR